MEDTNTLISKGLIASAKRGVIYGKAVLVPIDDSPEALVDFQKRIEGVFANLLTMGKAKVLKLDAEVPQEQPEAPPAPEPPAPPETPLQDPPAAEEVAKEIGTPEAVNEPAEYLEDLPQALEFLRSTLTEMRAQNADPGTLTVLIQAAAEAKDQGYLSTWKKTLHPDLVATLASKQRHPDEFVPKAVAHAKTSLTPHKEMSPEHRSMIAKIMQSCPENFKEATHDWITNGVKEGKVPYYLGAWEEVEFAVSTRGANHPVRMWQTIVDQRWQQDKMEKARQPAKVEFNSAVAWVQRWFTTYNRGELIQDNILVSPVPLAKRVNRERMIESAYFVLGESIKGKGEGACIDTLINAWSGPSPDDGLQHWWTNGAAQKFLEDGKRYAYSQQHFDTLATSLFAEVLSSNQPRLVEWRKLNEERLREHILIRKIMDSVVPQEVVPETPEF